MTITDPDLRSYLLAFADDEHLMGQGHTEWIGVAPFLEEDLAFASIGQDELGHAALLYELLDDDVDRLALHRDPTDYRSCELTELACASWDDALVRHWLYDAAEVLRWEALASSTVTELAERAHRALREEAFHRKHADAMLDALAGTSTAWDRILASLHRLLPAAVGLFESPDGEADLVAARVVGADVAAMEATWRHMVDDRFGPIGWAEVTPTPSRRDQRSDAFHTMYARMREVILLDPSATW